MTTAIAALSPADAPTAAVTGGAASGENAVHCLFSDLDGTLVHYPKDFIDYAAIIFEDSTTGRAIIRYNTSDDERECVILSSMTGGKAYMSVRTVQLIARLRAMGVVFVIVTGARTSTYVTRRAVLPPADYEFFENGGRMLADGVLDAGWTDSFAAQVGLVADRVTILPKDLPPPESRKGTLWELYNILKEDGWNIDARDYTTSFRVDVAKSEGKTVDDFYAISTTELGPRKLASSFNLGKADIYPAGSGKANAAANILKIHGWSPNDAVAMFDDDNDLELGALVGRSFLPGVTHSTVLEAMIKQGDRWCLTTSRGFLGTEEALLSIIALRENFSRQAAT
jgi:hydroxymethylpyrimidine pyrophosphatase-like HAD family hydrolase